MIFETERLILRPWAETDAESLYEYARDPAVGPAAGWPVHTSVQSSLEVIRNVLSKPETYAVADKKTGCAVGSIGLMIGKASPMELPETEAEIGYWIGMPYWGQGLIPEAVRVIIGYAFEQLHLEKLWCGYYDGNIKSARVQEKCGFSYQYTRENVQCSMLNEVRTEHITCLTKEKWNENEGFSLS